MGLIVELLKDISTLETKKGLRKHAGPVRALEDDYITTTAENSTPYVTVMSAGVSSSMNPAICSQT